MPTYCGPQETTISNQTEVMQHKNKLVTFVQLTWCKRVQWLKCRHLFIEFYKDDGS